MDLMIEQIRQGNEVCLLWPGRLKNINDISTIKKRQSYYFDDTQKPIKSFELYNPLPVPLLNGINNVSLFTQNKCIKSFLCFLEQQNFDVLHVHTLMGLPREFLQACKSKNICTVFTTHDYFGICPKWGLERNGLPCVDDHQCADCAICNQSALSLDKLRFLQSDFYRLLKDTAIFRLARKKNNSSLYIYNKTSGNSSLDGQAAEYRSLRQYYIDILESFDTLLFNSKLTMEVYSRYCDISRGRVLSLTHSSIRDHRISRQHHTPVRFGYLGPVTKHKGYFTLLNACNRLWGKQPGSFELHIYAECDENLPYLRKHKSYRYSELPSVMDEFDVLVVPSQWYETFGFTVLEALSFGIPCVVTQNVGAQDLINQTVDQRNGVICSTTIDGILLALQEMVDNPDSIRKMNDNICKHTLIQTIDVHAKTLNSIYANLMCA